MNFLVILGIIFIVLYSCVSWLIPTFLAWLFKRKYHIKLKIGRIAIPKLILKDVNLSKDGYSAHIQEISIKSSFFNSEINKLVSVIVKDVEFTNIVEERRSVVVETILKPLLSKQNSTTSKIEAGDEILDYEEDLRSALSRKSKENLMDFQNKKFPPSLVLFAQFMGVHIFKVKSKIQVGKTENALIVETAASEVHADGAAGGPARALAFTINFVEITAKVMLKDSQQSLGEAACSFLIEGTVRAEGPFNVEKIYAALSNPVIQFQNELINVINNQNSVKKPVEKYHDGQDHLDTLVMRISPVIPKIFSLRIDATAFSYIDNITNTNFQLSLQSLQVNSRFSATSVVVGEFEEELVGPPQLYVAVQMDQFQVITNVYKLMFLDKLKLDAKLEKTVLNLYLILSTLNLTYNHKEVIRWYSAAQERKSKPLQVKYTHSEGWAGRACAAWRGAARGGVAGCVELRAARLRLVGRARPLALGATGVKLKLTHHAHAPEEACGSLWWRQCSAELLLDSGWLSAAEGARGAPARAPHSWGEALLAVALVTWPRAAQVEAMMDCLRFEWSPTLAKSVIDLMECFREYKEFAPQRVAAPTEPLQQPNYKLSINIAISHINLFMIVTETICLMTRIDAITLERKSNKSSAVISGLKTVDMVPYKSPTVQCKKSDEIRKAFFYVKLARIEQRDNNVSDSTLLDLQFLESVDFEWCVNLHLKIYTFVKGVKGFLHDIRQCKEDGNIPATVGKKKRPINWKITFKSDTSLGLILSDDNNMLFATDDMIIAYDNEAGLSVFWSILKLLLNSDEILTVDGFHLARLADDHDVRVERKACEGFQLAWNKVWGVNVDSVRLIFPYQHRFADAVQGDFVTLVKWLKLTHGIVKQPFTADSPLPSDLCIKIEELVIEMSDDPFEVKLRDNYELLEDEYKESQKRRSMLDAKVQELRRPHLFLPAGKVEELYAALRQKDAQIYVQRSRAAPPPRARLVACCLQGLRVLALADPALHGADTVRDKLRHMDHDTIWPEEPPQFATLWCRWVSARADQWSLLLRDFPQPLLRLERLRMWGTLVGAEGEPPPRAIRTVEVDEGPGWGRRRLERSLMPLKWYHDLCCQLHSLTYAFGPCWEPVIAQCNLAFDQVSRPSLDPSQPLAFWDKVRLLLHGRLTANVDRLTCLLHVSLDPYNTTEEMEVTWNDLVLDWTNGKVGFLGSLNVFVRTASKYDDCRVLRVPALKLGVKLGWRCVGEPRDHHAVAPTAPTRLPEYSSNQEHDSYRAFRSQGLDVHLSLDTRPLPADGPVLLLYGSTLRWFESLKLILSGTTRPTRRGRLFGNVRPRKPQLSRHYKDVSVSLTLHNLQVFYWSSSSMQRGIEILGVRVTCGSKHALSLVASGDGLVRRPRANWTTVYMNCELNDAEIWLKCAQPADGDKDRDNDCLLQPAAMEKCYCMSVRRVSYGREAGGAGGATEPAPPTHRLAVHDLRGAWTKINRDLAFALLDTYIKTQQLKKNLSTKALKEEEPATSSPHHQREADVCSPQPSANQSGDAEGMLRQLVSEGGGEAPLVFSDELAGTEPPPPPRAPLDAPALTACLIELVNSQVVLKGCETRGYVVLCAARAEVRQRVRRAPRAVTWSGSLSAMQYYATVSEREQLDENIQWISVSEIEERWSGGDVPRLLGSGHSAGGVIGSTVGPSADASLTQLQRIVSRCACEFYYVTHAEGAGRRAAAGWGQAPEPCDSFTLMHHDLDVCTNSLQYAMLLDVVNNVVLHVEPARRQALERRARLRFQLQLHQHRDPTHIHTLQGQVRESLARLRRLEKEYYLKNRSITGHDPAAIAELKSLDKQVNECKEAVWALGDELDAMVRAWRETAAARAPSREPAAPPLRHHEICFKSARWRLTDADGQLGIADLLLTNFLYTKTSRSDDSVEHQLEVGYVRVTNLLPNEPFPEVLVPQEPSGRAPLARRAALRVFCRDRLPVGGIAVKEHFEVNIVPIKIGLTKKFFNTMLKFCFPERDPETIEEGEEEAEGSKAGSSASLVPSGSKKGKKKKDSNSNFYVKRDKKDKDDVEKMKERAEKNKLFIYIKIPEVPVRVSYKGSKEKNLEDLRDLPLLLPTLEYHNVTWTWLDLLLATKSDTRRVLLSQAIRQKLQLHRRTAAEPQPQEEDKARMLLGERTVTENKPHKKSTPGSVFKFSKS